MAYPPSSTVSYFNQICIISNLNDWLIVGGVFFVIRCIILLGNKTILQDGRRSSVWRLRILSFSVGMQIVDDEEATHLGCVDG